MNKDCKRIAIFGGTLLVALLLFTFTQRTVREHLDYTGKKKKKK